MLGVALLLLACVLLAIAAASTARLLRPDSALDAAITFGVVAAAGVAAVLLVAGTVGQLRAGPVLALVALWAICATVPAWRGGPPVMEVPRPRPSALLRSPWEAAVVALAGLALAWQLLVALVLPPFAFDGITYHLTMVATWLREGNVEPTPLSLCCAYYPANSELMFAWPVLFLGTDTVVDTVQIGFVVLGALAVAGITRSAGLPASCATAAAGLFAVTPIVLAQASTNYADVIVAACALAALHALLRFAATGAPPRLLVAGLAAGLLLGMKGTGAVWAAALLLGALAIALTLWRTDRISGRVALSGVAGFLAVCLALGSYWYARNWIDTGNPAYPFRIQAGGTTLFDGPLRVDEVLTQPPAGQGEPWPVSVLHSWASDIDFWRQGSYDYQQRLGGLGPLWPWLALPLLVPLAVVLGRRRSPVLPAMIGLGVVLAVQPYQWWSRFTIPLAAMGAIAVVGAALWAPRPWMGRLVRAAALALALAGVALTSFEVDPAARARSLPARDVLGLVGTPQAERTVGRLFFPEYRFLDRVPDDATVVVDLAAPAVRFVYPLFGPEHSREVLPARSGQPPRGTWVVTSAGRRLDRALRADARFRLAFARRGVRVWKRLR